MTWFNSDEWINLQDLLSEGVDPFVVHVSDIAGRARVFIQSDHALEKILRWIKVERIKIDWIWLESPRSDLADGALLFQTEIGDSEAFDDGNAARLQHFSVAFFWIYHQKNLVIWKKKFIHFFCSNAATLNRRFKY